MTPIIYALLIFTVPSACRPTTDGWQLFVDSDLNPATGYGQGYEYVVRGIPGESLDLRDWQQVQNLWGETLESAFPDWRNENLVLIRETEGGGGNGGWGRLAGIAKATWAQGMEKVTLQLPSLLSGRYRLEVYANGSWCPG